MALSPTAATKLTKDEVDLVNQLEQRIDLFLQKEYRGLGEHIVPPAFPMKEAEKLRPCVIEELSRRYVTAGWKKVALQLSSDNGFGISPPGLLFYDEQQE